MGFENLMNGLRKRGRKFVLPIEEVGTVLSSSLKNPSKKDCLKVIDFGSGTLFWTEFMMKNITCRYEIYAVDPIYGKSSFDISSIKPEAAPFVKISDKDNLSIAEANTKNGRIFLLDDIEKIPDICERFDLMFMCDVIHHLEAPYWERIFDLFLQRVDTFVIKDINAHQKIGNTLNKLHDKLINGENIVDVYPDTIRNKFIEKDFSVSDIKLVPKLWYPHFIIKADSNKKLSFVSENIT